jgi:hypothetical protein
LRPSTERRPLRMHSLSPVPSTITSYSSSIAPTPIYQISLSCPFPLALLLLPVISPLSARRAYIWSEPDKRAPTHVRTGIAAIGHCFRSPPWFPRRCRRGARLQVAAPGERDAWRAVRPCPSRSDLAGWQKAQYDLRPSSVRKLIENIFFR